MSMGKNRSSGNGSEEMQSWGDRPQLSAGWAGRRKKQRSGARESCFSKVRLTVGARKARGHKRNINGSPKRTQREPMGITM